MSDINMGDEPLNLDEHGLREVFEFIEEGPQQETWGEREGGLSSWHDHLDRIEQARRAEDLHKHGHEVVRDQANVEFLWFCVRDALQDGGLPYSRACWFANKVVKAFTEKD